MATGIKCDQCQKDIEDVGALYKGLCFGCCRIMLSDLKQALIDVATTYGNCDKCPLNKCGVVSDHYGNCCVMIAKKALDNIRSAG